MQQYVLRRLLLAIPVLFGLSLLTFASIRLVPGDVVVSMTAEAGNVPHEQRAALRHKLGLDQSFVTQYLKWIGGLAHGDFGKSLWRGSSVGGALQQTLPVTVELAVLALIIGVALALPIGVISAIRQDTWMDYVGRLFSIGALSMPDFWLGTMAVLYLSLWFHWVPPIGKGFRNLFEDPSTNLQIVALPALILGLRLSAGAMRLTRSAMLEVLREEYIRTAWSKGLRERAVRYAARPQERHDPGHNHPRGSARFSHRRDGGARDVVWHPRDGTADARVGHAAGLSAAAGQRHGDRDVHRAAEPGGRPHLRLARPEDSVRLGFPAFLRL